MTEEQTFLRARRQTLENKRLALPKAAPGKTFRCNFDREPDPDCLCEYCLKTKKGDLTRAISEIDKILDRLAILKGGDSV